MGLFASNRPTPSYSDLQDFLFVFFVPSKKYVPLHPLSQCVRKSHKSDQMLSSIHQLEEQIAYQIEKLRNLVSQISSKTSVDLYSADKVAASHEALATLSKKVNTSYCSRLRG